MCVAGNLENKQSKHQSGQLLLLKHLKTNFKISIHIENNYKWHGHHCKNLVKEHWGG